MCIDQEHKKRRRRNTPKLFTWFSSNWLMFGK